MQILNLNMVLTEYSAIIIDHIFSNKNRTIDTSIFRNQQNNYYAYLKQDKKLLNMLKPSA